MFTGHTEAFDPCVNESDLRQRDARMLNRPHES